jgi:hypothetical protein
MSRFLLLGLVLLAAATAAGCGSASGNGRSNLAAACRREQAGLARIAPVRDLGDAETALGAVVALERRVLARVRAAGLADDSLATQLRLSIQAATRSLAEIRGDAQGAMDPVRTGVPAARRAVGLADGLLQAACAHARA